MVFKNRIDKFTIDKREFLGLFALESGKGV